MAVYTATLISTNNLGGNTAITVKQSSENSSIGTFLATLSENSFVVSSLNISSNNYEQLRQPISIIKSPPDGKIEQMVKVFSVDSYQRQAVLNNQEFDNFIFDTNTSMNFPILANSKVEMTLNVTPATKENLLWSKVIKGDDRTIIDEAIESVDTGFREIEELSIQIPTTSPYLEKEELNAKEGKKLIEKSKTEGFRELEETQKEEKKQPVKKETKKPEQKKVEAIKLIKTDKKYLKIALIAGAVYLTFELLKTKK